MTTPGRGSGREKPPTELVAIEVGMMAFVTVMIVASYLTLGRSARLVPLIVGYPTLVLILFQFLSDSGAIDLVKTNFEPGDSHEQGLGDDLEAAMRVLDEEGGEPDMVDMRRYLVFGLWSIGFVVLAALTSFLVAVPIALFVILREATQSTMKTLAIVTFTSVLLYLIFDTFLQIPW